LKSVLFFFLFLIVALAGYLHYSERFAYLNGLVYQKIGWYDKSAEMYEKGCRSKNARACVEAAQMYENGEGGDVDLMKAREFYLIAYEYGFLPAKSHLERLESTSHPDAD